MRILYFGLTGRFSLPPLEALVTAGFKINAVILPAPHQVSETALPRQIEPPQTRATDLPLLDPFLTPNIVHVAWQHQIPIWEVGRLASPKTLDLLASTRPDVIVVACFSRIFPKAVLDLPRFGCLNLHPSLLPAYRGPEPLFWIARNDERVSGVTLHFLDAGIDSGDIISQARIARPDGMSGADLEQQCALEGGRLLVAALQSLQAGNDLSRTSQVEADASYHAWPTTEDLVIPTTWSARQAYNFVRGAEGWSLVVDVAGRHIAVQSALDYKAHQKLKQAYLDEAGTMLIQFQPGVLRVVTVH